ncbi:MAG: ABC transporter ATP-binding protein [Candidatus Bathyarchaeia archaeon]
MTTGKLLEIEGLHISYESLGGDVRALEDVALQIEPGEFVAVVGESGSGKSTLALSIIGLLPSRARGRGKILYKGVNLTELSKKEWVKYRGLEIGMIFQEPMTSLNPIEKVARQLSETIEGSSRLPATGHGDQPKGKDATREEALRWLRMVRISDPESAAERYPFQLSGGMMQRVMIAMALSLGPSLLLADEPTTALDVTTQAQILKLMKSLIDELNTSILLITHDLGVAAQVADRVIVLYAGEVVEEGPAIQVFSNPLHPYTKGLLKCYPKSAAATARLETITGSVPDLKQEIMGCKFADRCPSVRENCKGKKTRYIEVESNHYARCTLFY